MAAARKLVLLLHGWSGSRQSFGRLPEELEAHGHRVLPIFRTYATWTRGLRF
jgi:esterase/lipase